MKRGSRWRGRCSSSSCCTSRRRPTRRSRSSRSTPTSSAATSTPIRPWMFTWGELGLIQICGKNAANLQAVDRRLQGDRRPSRRRPAAGLRDQHGRDRALHAGDRGPSVRDLGPGRGRRSRGGALDRRRPAARHRQRAQPRHLLQDARPERADDSPAHGRPRAAVLRGRGCRGDWPRPRPADILAMVGWAFSLAMAGNFPALVMGIWWKRTTTAGRDRRHHRRLRPLPVLPGRDAATSRASA